MDQNPGNLSLEVMAYDSRNSDEGIPYVKESKPPEVSVGSIECPDVMLPEKCRKVRIRKVVASNREAVCDVR